MNVPNIRKIVSNSFNNGIDLDSNPMVISNDCLTNCLNGTLITHNGNEFILLNDMGNGRVESASLPSGYIPLGMKEHGGIIYVASKNVITGDCLVGCFPSPERNLDAEDVGYEPTYPTLDDFTVKVEDNTNVKAEITDDLKATRIHTATLNPGDSFYVGMLESEQDTNFLDYYVGYKTGSGGIEYLKTTNENGEKVNLSPEVITDELADKNFIKYEADSSGELYLITSVKMPSNIDLMLQSIDTNETGITFSYKIEAEAKESELYFIEYTYNAVKEKGDPESKHSILELTKYNENKKYEVILVNLNYEEGKLPYKYINLTVTPLLKSDNDSYIRIPMLSKTVSTDILAEQFGDVLLTLWRYSYNNKDLILDLTYGFSAAINSEVLFKFYKFNGNSFDSKSISVKPEERISYSGLFTDSITVLVPNNLYMCEILVTKYTNINNVRTKQKECTFYKLVWVTDLLNKFNTSQSVFDGGELRFSAYLDGKTEWKQSGLFRSDLEDKTDQTYNKDSSKYNSITAFTFTKVYNTTLTSTPQYTLDVPDLSNFPFDISDLKIGTPLNPKDNNLFDYSAVIKSNDDVTINKVGTFALDYNNSDVFEVSGDTVITKYKFAAGVQEVENVSDSVKSFTKYLDPTRSSRGISDKKLIYGDDSGIPFAVGMGMSKKSGDGKDKYNTYYGLYSLANAVTGGENFTRVTNNLTSGSASCKHLDISKVYRGWENQIQQDIKKGILDELGFLPAISCIASCRDNGGTYSGDWVNEYDDKKPQKDMFGYKDIDYQLVTEDLRRAGYRNYIIPLWLANERNDFYIMLNSVVKLDESYYSYDYNQTGNDDKGNYCHSQTVTPSYGKTITTFFDSLFSQLYVLDPLKESEVKNSYKKADNNNYTYFSEVSGNVNVLEKVNMHEEIFYSASEAINNKINTAIENFFNGNKEIEKINDKQGIHKINILSPTELSNTYVINIPTQNIAGDVQSYLGASENLSFSSYILEDGTNVYLNDISGASFEPNAVYYKKQNGFSKVGLNNDTGTINVNGYSVKASALKLSAEDVTIEGKPYKQVILTTNLPKISKDSGNGKNVYTIDALYAKLPHIGCLVTGENGCNDRGDLYPFSFIFGRDATTEYVNNYEFCVSLQLVPDNKRIKTLKS